jgi:hypothetical protein
MGGVVAPPWLWVAMASEHSTDRRAGPTAPLNRRLTHRTVFSLPRQCSTGGRPLPPHQRGGGAAGLRAHRLVRHREAPGQDQRRWVDGLVPRNREEESVGTHRSSKRNIHEPLTLRDATHTHNTHTHTHTHTHTGAGMKKTTKSFAYDKVFGRFATQGARSLAVNVMQDFSHTQKKCAKPSIERPTSVGPPPPNQLTIPTNGSTACFPPRTHFSQPIPNHTQRTCSRRRWPP